MNLPKELTTVTPISKTLAVLTFICILIVTFNIGRRYQLVLDLKPTRDILLVPTLRPYETTPAPGELILIPTEAPITTVMLPTTVIIPQTDTAKWLTYDKDFGGRIHFKFKYPSEKLIADGDPDSGSVEIRRVNGPDQSTEVELDTVQIPFAIYEPYTGGSRREWFLAMLKKYQGTFTDGYAQAKEVDYSGMLFTEVNFPNGKQYLLLSNIPTQSNIGYIKGRIYIGVQNGVMFSVISNLPDEATERAILSTIEASPPRSK